MTQKPTKAAIQNLLNKSSNYEVIQTTAFSNKQTDLKKIQDALNKGSVIIILKQD